MSLCLFLFLLLSFCYCFSSSISPHAVSILSSSSAFTLHLLFLIFLIFLCPSTRLSPLSLYLFSFFLFTAFADHRRLGSRRLPLTQSPSSTYSIIRALKDTDPCRSALPPLIPTNRETPIYALSATNNYYYSQESSFSLSSGLSYHLLDGFAFLCYIIHIALCLFLSLFMRDAKTHRDFATSAILARMIKAPFCSIRHGAHPFHTEHEQPLQLPCL